jgi:hypothetical protein
MSTPVTAALVSGGVALVVALLGIAGAIAAQLVATRRAYENSLALFERQHARQEATRTQERKEEARREDAYRFAEQRRSTYGRFVRLAREFVGAIDAERTVAKNLERIDRQRDRTRSRSADLEMSAEAAEQLVADARERRQRLDGEFGAACEEIHLLGSPEVRQAADHLWDVGHEATHSAEGDYMAARVAFLEAARQELGIVTSQRSPAAVEEPPDF